MSRVNVEESIYRDPRFIRLCALLENKAMALGYCVMAWDLAQCWFLKSPSRCIPLEEWNKNEICQEMITVGLAEMRTGGVYVKGSDDHCMFMVRRQSAGKKGGLKSKGKKSSKLKQTKQIQPSSSSSSSFSDSPSDSTSLSDSYRINTIAHSANARFSFEEAYQKYPRKLGKQRGLKIFRAQIKTAEDFQNLLGAIDRYSKWVKQNITDAAFIKHFSTFMGSWRDWLDPEVGRSTLSAPIKSIDEVLNES